jgi:hypothetical protein
MSGIEVPYEVRAELHQKLTGFHPGEMVTLLVDNENSVIDVAIPPWIER